METFIAAKKVLKNPLFEQVRERTLTSLHANMIDVPIREIIDGLNHFSYCFTLQCCYGYFLYQGQDDPHNCLPLPDDTIFEKVEYRLAYIAFCIEDNVEGRALLTALKELVSVSSYIQFGSAQWFWDFQVNSYVLQVMPDTFKTQDRVLVDYDESRNIENARNTFFKALKNILN